LGRTDPINPTARTLILTNDDGLEAPGLDSLRIASEGLGVSITIAPEGPQSGCGHAVTTHRAIQVERRGDRRFAIHGTPADCVRLAIHHLASNASWVLAGINAGGNLGVDIYHSGTVAAVREAVIHGVPGFAISHYIARGRQIDWVRATRWTARVLRELIGRPWEPGTFWNVNLPHPEPNAPEPRIVFCAVDPSPLPLSFRLEGDSAHYGGDYHSRHRLPARDIDVCFRGDIAISRIRLIASDHALGETSDGLG
jgi:5'-nucleotidase